VAIVVFVSALSVSSSIGSTAGGGASAEPHPAETWTSPDIVLIMTDDQRWDTLSAMPTIESELVSKGVNFVNAFAPTPLCCPSRASFLTGAYAHTTDVYKNEPPHGGFDSFDDSSTVATWLDAAGYETMLDGKYLNGYDLEDHWYIPPGWDHWAGYQGGYYRYVLSVDGVDEPHQGAKPDYSTDVLRDKAVDFIRTTPAGTPLFLFFTPFAPHPNRGKGPKPAPRHIGMFDDLPDYRPPSFNEADVSDKPGYIRALPPMTQDQIEKADDFRRKQYEAVQAVDEAVAAIVAELTATGRISNTVLIFTSDQGITWGEHRWQTNKNVPYEESIRLPLVIRYDPLTTEARTETSLVANVDLPPTIAQLAGASMPSSVEGLSLVPFLQGDGQTVWRSEFPLEWLKGGNVPGYCGLRGVDENGHQFVYVRYKTGEEELYDLQEDPFELDNLASSTSMMRLDQLLTQTEALCSPPPPHYRFP
jgi:arylsulfatase A-like enzyme